MCLWSSWPSIWKTASIWLPINNLMLLLSAFFLCLFLMLGLFICFYVGLRFDILPMPCKQRHYLLLEIHWFFFCNLPFFFSWALSLFCQWLLLGFPFPAAQTELFPHWENHTRLALDQTAQTLISLEKSVTSLQGLWTQLEKDYLQVCDRPLPFYTAEAAATWAFYGFLTHGFSLNFIPQDVPESWPFQLIWTHRGLPREVHFWGFTPSHWAGFIYQGVRLCSSLVEMQHDYVLAYGSESLAATARLLTAHSLLIQPWFQKGHQQFQETLELFQSLSASLDDLRRQLPETDDSPAAWKPFYQKVVLLEAQALAKTNFLCQHIQGWSLSLETLFLRYREAYGLLTTASFLETALLSTTASVLFSADPWPAFPCVLFSLAFWHQGLWEVFCGVSWCRTAYAYQRLANDSDHLSLALGTLCSSEASAYAIADACFRFSFQGFPQGDPLEWALLDQWHCVVGQFLDYNVFWKLHRPKPGEFAEAISYPLDKLPSTKTLVSR